jgi:hypothetical protein
MGFIFCIREWYYYFSRMMVSIVVYNIVRIGGRASCGTWWACFLILSCGFDLSLGFCVWISF